MRLHDTYRLADVAVGCTLLTVAAWPLLGPWGVALGPSLVLLGRSR